MKGTQLKQPLCRIYGRAKQERISKPHAKLPPMPLIVILIILLVVFGGGGYYMGSGIEYYGGAASV
jgi:hypothetical protein